MIIRKKVISFLDFPLLFSIFAAQKLMYETTRIQQTFQFGGGLYPIFENEKRRARFGLPQVRRREAQMGQIQQTLDMLRLPSHNHVDVGHGNARQQTAVALLVHGDASSDDDEENIFGFRTPASAWPQEVPTHMGDAAQAAKRDGPKGRKVQAGRHHRAG